MTDTLNPQNAISHNTTSNLTDSTHDKDKFTLNSAYHFEENALIKNWQQVNERIANAINSISNTNRLAPRTKLIAVSKTKPVVMIDCLARQGQQDFGENYLQEAIDKITSLKSQTYPKPIIWHYIGHIQRNKTRDIAQHFDWVHTLERGIIAKRLNEQRPDSLPALNVLIQVNIDAEKNKSGCQPHEVNSLVEQILAYPRLNLRGLMIIPSKSSTDAFKRIQDIFKKTEKDYPQIENWDTLSMGMSNDMQTAIAHGSTMVRIGTAIFGTRN